VRRRCICMGHPARSPRSSTPRRPRLWEASRIPRSSWRRRARQPRGCPAGPLQTGLAVLLAAGRPVSSRNELPPVCRCHLPEYLHRNTNRVGGCQVPVENRWSQYGRVFLDGPGRLMPTPARVCPRNTCEYERETRYVTVFRPSVPAGNSPLLRWLPALLPGQRM